MAHRAWRKPWIGSVHDLLVLHLSAQYLSWVNNHQPDPHARTVNLVGILLWGPACELIV